MMQIDMTLTELLYQRAKNDSESTALVFPDRKGVGYSYKDVLHFAKTYAAYLMHIASGRRPTVVMSAVISEEWFWIFLGTILAGGKAVILSEQVSQSTLKRALHDNYADILYISPAVLNAYPNLNIYSKKTLIAGKLDKGIPQIGLSNNAVFSLSSSEDICLIQYTSGTDGVPKGVKLSHRALSYTAIMGLTKLGTDSRDKWLLLAPMFHIAGMYTMLLAFFSAASLYVPERFTPKRAVDYVMQYSLTATIAVPSVYMELIRRVIKTGQEIQSLKYGIISGSLIEPELLENIYKLLHMNGVCSAYGMTESAAAITMCEHTDPLKQKQNSVGAVLDGSDVKLIDPVSCKEVNGEDAQGEVCIKGLGMMSGYVQAEANYTKDGYFRTGDLGRFTTDGRLQITGRLKEIIICGGENISPHEIEKYLKIFPEIHDAVVTSVPDHILGEKIIAFAVPNNTYSFDVPSVKRFLGKYIEPFKIPDEIIAIDVLPKTESGKVNIRQLKESYLCSV